MNDRADKTAAGKHFATAQVLHRQGRLAEAEQQYLAALKLDGSHCDAKEWLGALCLQSGKIDEAIRWLGEAAAQRPENAVFHDNLAAAAKAGRGCRGISAFSCRCAACDRDAYQSRQRPATARPPWRSDGLFRTGCQFGPASAGGMPRHKHVLDRRGALQRGLGELPAHPCALSGLCARPLRQSLCLAEFGADSRGAQRLRTGDRS